MYYLTIVPLFLNIFVAYIILDAIAKVLLLLEPESRQYRIIMYSVLVIVGITVETGVLAVCIFNRLGGIPCEIIYPKYHPAFVVVWLAFGIASLMYLKGAIGLGVPYGAIVAILPHFVAFRKDIPRAVRLTSLGLLVYSILWIIGLIVWLEEVVILGIVVRDLAIMFGFRFGRS